ncbi:steroid 17-alpha-hydroxylase/17,20 lyase-like [Tubulanus polymorphus]|uniref:steroid 17-alpha-hydroxylase/17,20 lyase-like n=1 Tax=Tubulanus polymorphus TaxID=672921 RepID=UPI003DA284CB
MDPITLTLIAGALVIIYLYLRNGKCFNLPPGPKGYPLIGNLLDYKRDGRPPWLHFHNLTKTYGDIFNFKLGFGFLENIIVLNSGESINEAFLQPKSPFDARPKTWSLEKFTDGGRDIMMGDPDDPVWMLMRKLTSGGLRNFLSGARMDHKCHSSLEKGVTLLKQHLGEPFDTKPVLNLMIFNVICDMLFNAQFEFDDAEFEDLYTSLDAVDKIFGNVILEDVITPLQWLPFKTPTTRKAIELDTHVLDILGKYVTDHQEKYDPDDISDLIDYIIRAKKKLEIENPNLAAKLTERHMVQIVNDGFGAGTSTSSQTLYWMIFFMAKYPEIQTRVQSELDDTIGHNLPSMSDKPNLVYCEAVMLESMRFCPYGALALHATSTDAKLFDFDVPKGSQVWANIYASHHDEKIWPDPDEFKPERFIQKDGKIMPRPRSWLTFGAGRRSCIGEPVGRHQVFVFFTSLMQKFRFRFPDGCDFKDKPISPSRFESNGFVCMSKPYDIIIDERA